jgi:hypothetical protein
MPDTPTLWAASLYGVQTRTGCVELSEIDADGIVRWQRQVSIDEARAHAYRILEAAEAAETDELLVRWLTDEFKTNLETAARMFLVFRKLRDERRR